MIEIENKKECCGCEACMQICPKKSISLKADYQGFFYPEINKLSCIDCGLCEKVCPVINKTNQSKNNHSTLYAVKSHDDAVRKQSSSGGFFSLLADYLLTKGGVVYGAAFDAAFNVCHTRVDNIEDLYKLRGSKYVQSRIGQTFSECKDDLKAGKLVLFTGTPCQISALGHFLRKDYDNLIRLEVVCHGVPSPMIFKQYMRETINDDFAKIVKRIGFRDKITGWKKFSFSVTYVDDNQYKTYSECVTESLYMKGYLSHLYLRPSCFQCPAKNFTSGADFTIADFWGQEYTFPEFDADKGVSAVFVNTAKAREVFNKITAVVIERPFADFIRYNPSLVKSPVQTCSYGKFWKLYAKTNNLRFSIAKARENSFFMRVINKLRRIFR